MKEINEYLMKKKKYINKIKLKGNFMNSVKEEMKKKNKMEVMKLYEKKIKVMES